MPPSEDEDRTSRTAGAWRVCDLPAQDAATRPALRGLFTQLGGPARTDRDLEAWLQIQHRLGVNTDLVVAAFEHDRPIAAAMALGLPGRAAVLLLPPQIAHPHPSSVAEALLAGLMQRCRQAGLRLLQALTSVEDSLWGRVLQSGGLRFITRLIYLNRGVAEEPSLPPPAPDVTWADYSPRTHDEFVHTMERTYAGSLDFPELSAARGAEEALASHAAAGETGTQMWGLCRLQGQPVAVLLAVHHSALSVVEVAYMGVAREARGRGLGGQVLRRVREDAARMSANALALAVDRRNLPARRLYERWGFHPNMECDAWLMVLRGDRT